MNSLLLKMNFLLRKTKFLLWNDGLPPAEEELPSAEGWTSPVKFVLLLEGMIPIRER